MAAALAIAPFVFLNANHDPANLPQSFYAQAAGFAFAAWTMARAPRPERSLLDPAVLALLLWGLASVAWAQSRAEAWPVAWHWAGCAAWFLAVSRTVEGARGARTLALALFASGAGVAAIGLAQHLGGLDAFYYQAVPPAASFVHKNIASQYVIAVLPLGLAGWSAWPRGLRVSARFAAALVAAGVMGVFLLVARTRSAWAAVAIEAAVAAVLVLRRRRPRALKAAALLAIALAGIAVVASPALRARARGLWLPASPRGWEAAPAYTSVHHRQAIWLNTAAMIADAPVRGVGLGNHKVHYPAYARRAAVDAIMGAESQLDHVHNDFLQLTAETGLVGAALALWLLARAVGAWRRAASSAPEPLVVAWAVAAAGLATDSLFSFPLQRALPPVIAAVGLGSLAALAGLAPGRGGRAAARAMAVAAGVAAIAVVAVQSRAVRADRLVLRMLAAEGRGEWPSVRGEAEAVLRIDPRHRQALFSLGTASLAQRRLPEARASFRRLLEEHPHDLAALGNLAMVQAAAGDDMGALALYDRVLALDPDDHRAHFGRGEVLARRGATWPALYEFRLAVDLDRGNPRYQLRRGQAAARAGSYPEAATAFRAALALQPRLAAAHAGLGRVLADYLGRPDEGREHLRIAEEITAGRR